MLGSKEKNLGQKVNVKFFGVDPYMLGLILHWVFVPFFFWESLYMWGIFGANSQ